MRAQIKLVAVVGAVALTAGPAFAGDFLIKKVSAANPFVAGTQKNTSLFYEPEGNDILSTGTFNLLKSGDGGMSYDSFLTYCVEVGKPAPPTTSVNYNVRPLSDAFTPSEVNALRIIWKNAFSDSTMSAINAAAFQAIVWEMANDDSFNLVPGLGQNFYLAQIETDARNKANEWYTKATDGTWTTMANLSLLVTDVVGDGEEFDYQDLLMEMPGTIIPLPTAGLMASVGLLGLASVRRRNRA